MVPRFDAIYMDKIGLVDFSKIVSIQGIYDTPDWPLSLVEQSSISLALADEVKMLDGWLPEKSDLVDAPLLRDWYFLDQRGTGQGLFLRGICQYHPRLGARNVVTTSHLVAIDLENFKWARTLSRFYRLGDQA